jgi:hypothetical protein
VADDPRHRGRTRVIACGRVMAGTGQSAYCGLLLRQARARPGSMPN